jgi:hypothetical protein
MIILSVATLVIGCGSGAVRAPETPPKPVDPETRVERHRKDPRLIAPPPAYGNKVVMASVGQAGAVN